MSRTIGWVATDEEIKKPEPVNEPAPVVDEPDEAPKKKATKKAAKD